MKVKLYIVLNPAKNEGFATTNRDDAVFASTGVGVGGGLGESTIAEELRDAYCSEDETELPMCEVEIDTEDTTP